MNTSLNPNENAAPEQTYQQIDEAIKQHQNFILALNSRRNALAHISRLPPEILSKIFSFVQSVQKLAFTWLRPSYWIQLSHVCRHWRHVAITSPILWTELPLDNRRWLEESLRRSQRAGLVVIGGFVGKASIPGLKLAMKHISRIKYLSLPFDSKLWNIISKNLPMSAPRLEVLCLRGVHLSDKVLCDAKRLRYLELARCEINWDSPLCLFHSLTHLTLRDLTNNSKPSGKHFVDAMKRMPDLEVLILDDALPVEQTLWASDRIHFTRLQSLVITSTYTETEIFFRCFTFPPTARVFVNCCLKESPHSDTDFSGIIFGLSRSYLPKLSDSHFQTFILLQPLSDHSRVHFRLYKDAFADDYMIDHYLIAPALELQFQFRFRDGSSKRAVKKLLNNLFDGAMPLQGIQCIHMGTMGPVFQPDMLASTLGRLPQVYSVVAGKYSSRLLFDALEFRSSTQGIMAIGAIGKHSFPNLSSIYLHRTKFEDPNESPFHPWPTVLSFRSLQDCLIDRREYGTTIKELTLKGCRELPEDAVTLLKDIVADVQIVNDSENDQEQDVKQRWTYELSNSDEEEDEDEAEEDEDDEDDEDVSDWGESEEPVDE